MVLRFQGSGTSSCGMGDIASPLEGLERALTISLAPLTPPLPSMIRGALPAVGRITKISGGGLIWKLMKFKLHW